MKIVVLLTFLLFTGAQSFAQQVSEDKLFYLKKSEKYRKMRNTGRVLTLGGSVLMIIGVVSLVNSVDTNTYYGQSQPRAGNAAGGVVAYVAGVAGIGAGIPLWIVGGINHGKYERKFQSVSAGLNVNPQTTGFKLTYRF